MKYLDKTFSAPAGPAHISQRDWDYATLSRDEFIRKHYPMDPMRYGDPRIDFSVTSRQCWAHGPMCTRALSVRSPDGSGTIGAVIKTAKICRCAMCGAEWLPQKTQKNPSGDPTKVERCASCKSWRWNDDDPRAARKKKRERPITPHQQELAKKTIARARAVQRAKDALDRSSPRHDAADAPGNRDKGPRVMCRHRVYDCPICNPAGA